MISHVRELAAKYDLDFTSVPIESVLTCEKTGIPRVVCNFIGLTLSTAKQLKTHLGTLSDDVVEEIESIYKENCLRRVALLHNCNCIVYGNNSTGGAIDALIQIARGKGTSLPRLFGPKDMQYCDKRELFFLRPLTGFTSKEVSMYVRIKGLSTITTKSQFLGQSKKTTRSTIRDFILNSDSGSQVSSTVVAAIASKIKPSAALPFSDICRLCGAPAENNAREWIAEKCKPVPSGRCTNVSECEDSLRSLSLSGSSLPPSGGIEGPPMCYSCIRLADDCSAPSSVSRRRDRVKASDPNFRPVDPSELRDNLLNVREVKGPDAAAAERKTIPQPSAGADL